MLMKLLVVLITLADDFLTFYNMFINNYSCNNTKLFRPWDCSGAPQDSTVSTTNAEEGVESVESAKKYLQSRGIYSIECYKSLNISLDSPEKRIDSVSEKTNETKSESKIQMKSSINHLYPASFSCDSSEKRTDSVSENVNKFEEEVTNIIKSEPKSPHEPSNSHQDLYQMQYSHPAHTPSNSLKKRMNSVSEKTNKTKNSFKSESKSKKQGINSIDYSHPACDSKEVAQTKTDAPKSFMPVKPEHPKSTQGIYPMEYDYFHPAYPGDFYQHNLASNLLPSGDAALVETLSQGIALEEYMRVLSQEQHEKMLAAKKQRPKKYKCPHCDVGFSNNGQLKGHIRIHTGERPFKCDEKECGKTFTRNEELTRHKRIHSGLRPFPCTHCGKRFGRKDHLKKHSRTHFQSRGMYAVPVMLPVEAWAASASSYPFIPMFGF